jgi:hypothetical protein
VSTAWRGYIQQLLDREQSGFGGAWGLLRNTSMSGKARFLLTKRTGHCIIVQYVSSQNIKVVFNNLGE